LRRLSYRLAFVSLALLLSLTVGNHLAQASNYAVLINGGYNVANGSPTYWNDMSAMYKTLKNTYGYTDENIFVLNSDGTDPANDMKVLTDYYDGDYHGHYYASSALDLDGDSVSDIDYAATPSNLGIVFDTLSTTMTSDDMLFVMSTDHGARNGGANSSLYLWGEAVTDADFAAEVNKINNYALEAFVFQQCYSGGFLDNLAGDTRRVIVSSADYDETSWGWIAGDPGLDGYAEFAHHYTAAVAGSGDANGDGYVSLREAYDYALLNDYFGPNGPDYRENPQYLNHEDTGDWWTLAGPIIVPEPVAVVFFVTGLVGVFRYAARKRMRKS